MISRLTAYQEAQLLLKELENTRQALNEIEKEGQACKQAVEKYTVLQKENRDSLQEVSNLVEKVNTALRSLLSEPE